MSAHQKQIDPLGDGTSCIELIDTMGTDLTVVNDARASFDRVSSTLDERDKKLIRYLVMHDHTSPLRGTIFKFRVQAPLFVCRQWWKHIIASVHASDQIGWNEKSHRYMRAEKGNYYVPIQFFQQAESNRQASGDPFPPESNESIRKIYEEACDQSMSAYSDLLDLGVSREQARGVLPHSVYTTWVWTCSLQATLNFIDLRAGHDSQPEIQKYARAVRDLISDAVPVTMSAWNEKQGMKIKQTNV